MIEIDYTTDELDITLCFEFVDNSFSHEFGIKIEKGYELSSFIFHLNESGKIDQDIIDNLDLDKLLRDYEKNFDYDI